MDDLAYPASPGTMTVNIVYALLFLGTMVLQTAAVASLPEPYRLFPLALVIGVIVLHERSLVLGSLWIGVSGFILEARGLGEGLAFAGVVAAVAAVVLTLSVFAKRSFWALLGVGMSTAFVYVIARLLWLAVWAMFTQTQIGLGPLFKQGLTLMLLATIGVFIFGAYLRRLLRWTRDKFVSKGQFYDISLPQ